MCFFFKNLFIKIELKIILFLYIILIYLNLYFGPSPSNFLDPSLAHSCLVCIKYKLCSYQFSITISLINRNAITSIW
jgi:hypothetical protein